MNKPKPTHVNYSEGGVWHEWLGRAPNLVFAVKFEDGSIFDPIAGWRNTVKEQMEEVKVPPIPPIDTRVLELIQLALYRVKSKEECQGTSLNHWLLNAIIHELQGIIKEHRT